MWTYNCARVCVGDYSYSKTHTYPETAPGGTYETCERVSCGYKTLKGGTRAKRLSPVKVEGADDEGEYKYHLLHTLAIYPTTDIAIIAVYNRKGKHLIKLIKRQKGSRNTMFKARL